MMNIQDMPALEFVLLLMFYSGLVFVLFALVMMAVRGWYAIVDGYEIVRYRATRLDANRLRDSK